MLDVTGSKGGLTVEGIGDDANILKWGFTFKSNCQDVEVRNLTFSSILKMPVLLKIQNIFGFTTVYLT